MIKKGRLRQEGFSMLEMLVVIVLIVGLSVVILPSITARLRYSLNSSTREIASIVKDTYNTTLVTRRVNRIAYDLQKNQYWSEIGPDEILFDSDASKEREAKRLSLSRNAEKEKKDTPGFVINPTVNRKKLSLPRGIQIKEVRSQHTPEPITEGMAYTHILPSGFTEKTYIFLEDTGGNQMTLIVQPFMGKTKLVNRFLTEEDVKRDQEASEIP